MFTMASNLGISDYAVRMAIKELQAQGCIYISASALAEEIRCDRNCVHRSLRRLMEAKKIKRGQGGRKEGGYQYELL